jgi:hypothetical protein
MVRGASWCHRRVDDRDVVELRSAEEVQRWRLVRTSAQVPATLNEEKREGVTRSELVLALPLDAGGGADASREREAHAYLPVRGYGFRFVVQADFILCSSREDILADRPWNLWLRDQVAPLFVAAVEAFRQTDSGLRLTFLHYVPEQTPAGLFGPVLSRIHESLCRMDCILTASGQWAKPCKVIVASEQLQAVISDDDVQLLLGREYMATQFKAPLSLLRSLGTLVFQLPELLQCLRHEEWLRGKPDGWFACLFAHLSTLDLKQDLDKVKALRIVPLEAGTLTAVAECKGRVFLPLTRETNYGFEDRLPLVRKEVFEGADEATTMAARKFLRSLGVKKADPPDLITEYILRLFETEEAGISWKVMRDGFCIGAVEYIRDYLEEYKETGNDLSRLTKGLYIKFVHPDNCWYTRADHLYLGEVYGNPNHLEKLLEGLEEPRFVDPVYLERGLERLARKWKKPLDSEPIQRRRRREAESWRGFFLRIGLVETIRVIEEPTDTEPGKATSPDLAALFAAEDRQRIGQVACLLDANWSYYRAHLFTEVRRREHGRLVRTGRVRTTFGELLASTCWLPDTAGDLRRPPELFLDTPQNREVLGEDLPYLATALKDQRLVEDLGICKEPTVEAGLSRLRNLADRRATDVDAKRKLYQFLDQQFDEHGDAIVASFSKDPLFLIPGCPARFLTLGKVFWQDPGAAFLDSRGSLAPHWPDLKPLFIRKLDVPVGPSAEDYAAMLRELSEEEGLSPQQERAVWTIYRELDRWLAAADDWEEVTREPWWRELVQEAVFWTDRMVQEAVFWTDRSEFWCNEGDLFVNDHSEFHRVFKNHPKVAFLKLPPNQHPKVSRFLKATGIPLLSEAVAIRHADPARLQDHPHLTARCRGMVPYLLRYLFFRENETYRE